MTPVLFLNSSKITSMFYSTRHPATGLCRLLQFLNREAGKLSVPVDLLATSPEVIRAILGHHSRIWMI